MSICAVIPAAGNGTRLVSSDPKVFTKVLERKVVWDFLLENIKPHVDSFNLILKPGIKDRYSQHLSESIIVSEQDVPLGMGDAIFRGYDHWRTFDHILVVWGDQINISSSTLERVTAELSNSIVIPFVKPSSPYVEYVFENEKLITVLQSREGDMTSPGGLSDIGVFLLPTKNLKKFWNEYKKISEKGASTGELNFLPFFTYLNSVCGMPIKRVLVENVDEAKGLNTKDDLAFFQSVVLKNKS